MKFVFERQLDDKDCGPTCLSMIARYYGIRIPRSAFKQLFNYEKEGVSLFSLTEASTIIGLTPFGVKLTVRDLIKCAGHLPCILHWNAKHFVVLLKITKEHYVLADPAYGKIVLSSNEFTRMWLTHNDCSGVALFFSFDPGRSRMLVSSLQSDRSGVIRVMISYLKSYRRKIILICGVLGMLIIVQISIPFLTREIIDSGLGKKDLNLVFLILSAQLVLIIGRLTFEYFKVIINAKVALGISRDIVLKVVSKLMNLPVKFYDRVTKGNLLQKIQDHHRISAFLADAFPTFIFSVTSVIIYSVLLASFSLLIFTVFFSFCVISIIWSMLVIAKRNKADYTNFDVLSEERDASNQLIDGVNEIKLFSIQNKVRSNWSLLMGRVVKANLRIVKLNQLEGQIGTLLAEVRNLIIVFISAELVINNYITFGTFVAIQLLVSQLANPIDQLVSLYRNFHNAKLGMNRLGEVLGEEEEFAVTSDSAEQRNILSADNRGSTDGFYNALMSVPLCSQISIITGDFIEIKNLSFSYNRGLEEPILKDISLRIPLGKTTALVGRSGSGKTTILKLLLKFYKPQAGTISVGKYPLDSIPHQKWRAKCSTIMQDSFIFADSIAWNIALCDEKIDFFRLDHAVEIAQLKDEIEEMPNGINTIIGEGGRSLSGGQRQRILIARAVYKDADFIFMDEPTNGLDSENERLIQESLKIAFENKTIICVAHRLSTISAAQQIFVIKNGEILESGDHTGLLQNRNEYFHLIKSQLY